MLVKCKNFNEDLTKGLEEEYSSYVMVLYGTPQKTAASIFKISNEIMALGTRSSNQNPLAARIPENLPASQSNPET
jgi:hypothetical protein